MSKTQEAYLGGSNADKAITQFTKQPSTASETGMKGKFTSAIGQLALEIQADEGLLQLVHIYQKADNTKRQLLLETSQSIAKHANPYAVVYEKTYTRDPAPFRFLDLLIELRIHIMEYALSHGEALQWIWLTYRHDECIGTFQGLGKLTAITRTSRQVHSESSNMVWKFNTFCFDEGHFGDEYVNNFINLKGHSTNFSIRLAGSIAAGDFFLQSLPITSFELLKSKIEFRAVFPSQPRAIVHCFGILSKLDGFHPGVVSGVKASDWTVEVRRGNGRMLVSADGLSSFILKGEEIRDLLRSAGFAAEDCGWRLFPASYITLDTLGAHLEQKHVELASRWFKDGL